MRRNFHIQLVSIALLCGVFLIAGAVPAHAEFSLLSVVSEPCRDCGACSICDLMSVVTKTMRFVLSLAGALALALFIWGGWEMMLSGGKAEEVEHGKKVISGTVVGLVIILLLAWVWPNWVILALKGVPNDSKSPQTIFSNDAWWVTPCLNFQEPNRAKLCVKRPEPPPAEQAPGECLINVGSPKPIGEKCNLGGLCAKEPCVCDGGGICKEGCIVHKDCQEGISQLKFENVCYKEDATKYPIGVCVIKKPGDSCRTKDDCQPYIAQVAVGRSLAYATIPMYCADYVCRINPGGYCKSSTADSESYELYCDYYHACSLVPDRFYSTCTPISPGQPGSICICGHGSQCNSGVCDCSNPKVPKCK